MKPLFFVLPAALAVPFLATAEPALLDRVVLLARHYDNAVGSSDAASEGVIRADLLKSRPAQRPGEVLEFVPGVIVTQHSGDGKANQYFLRGFNLDHGTDFATSVAGMPVNMPSHGHGQGYSDLNFLIPELVERIEYRKGPYFARNGDFASAGSADIRYRDTLDGPFAELSLGRHGYRRTVAGASTALDAGLRVLGVAEVLVNDGPWQVAEGLRKGNAVLSLSGGTPTQGWSARAMAYQARWTATDQVPERLLTSGAIDRFASLDPSDGGRTHRRSLSAEGHGLAGEHRWRASAYAIDYQLELFSNFTYALERPESGDQFSQQDRRRVFGGDLSSSIEHRLGDIEAKTEWGLQWRADHARVGLFDTQARRRLATTREDRVRQWGGALWAQTSLELAPWLRVIPGLRWDQARFRVDSLHQAANSGRTQSQQLSPKFSLIAGPWARTEVFFNAGRGLHSNDARGTTARIDPKTGEAVEPVRGFAASRGLELGARSEWLPGLQTSLALWRLNFDSELIYVGDAGTTEANRPSRRHGVEWNNRWRLTDRLLLDTDLAWTHARFADADAAGSRIPNAVDRVASVALAAHDVGPWSGSLQWRYLGSGALVEDNSVRSRASLTTNLRLARALQWGTAKASLTLDVFNLLDRKVNDIEYFYASRLPGEASAQSDRHVHPAEPRSLRLSLRLDL